MIPINFEINSSKVKVTVAFKLKIYRQNQSNIPINFEINSSKVKVTVAFKLKIYRQNQSNIPQLY